MRYSINVNRQQSAQQPTWMVGFILHLVTGVIATAAHYLAMWAFLQTGMPSLAATSSGFLFGAVTRFLLSYFHVFSPTTAIPHAVWRFILALMFQMLCNTALVALFLHILPLWYAQVATTILMTVVNYMIYRIWVFK